MAVFVYKTGAIPRASLDATTTVSVTVTNMNDDLGVNTARIIYWEVPAAGVKTALSQTAFALLANNNLTTSFTVTSTVAQFAVEVRYSNPNIVPEITLVGGAAVERIQAGEMFFASSPTDNP
ncbi:hypothetical protein [Cohnella massiliensis]|uniref:hypothetical protein n=1 Tax=Cohnella massiliensis TaxID=1816691 RepID=UPI0009B9BF5E|nr:hypothetical protein [Cohnella massiliensis]